VTGWKHSIRMNYYHVTWCEYYGSQLVHCYTQVTSRGHHESGSSKGAKLSNF